MDLRDKHLLFRVSSWPLMRPLSMDSQFVRKDAETNRNAIDKIKAEGIRRWGKSAQIAFVFVAHDIPRLSKKKEWN